MNLSVLAAPVDPAARIEILRVAQRILWAVSSHSVNIAVAPQWCSILAAKRSKTWLAKALNGTNEAVVFSR